MRKFKKSVRFVGLRRALGVVVALAACIGHPASTSATPPPNPEIVFTDSGLKVMNADGTNVRTVMTLKSGESIGKPVWSPTGSQLAFTAKLGGVLGLYTINLDGTNRRLLTTLRDSGTGLIAPVDWARLPAPDGQFKICYRDMVPNPPGGIMPGFPVWDVVIINPDGTGKVNISSTPGIQEFECSWTRNGAELAVYGRGPLGTSYADFQIYTLGLDGAGNIVPVDKRVLFTSASLPPMSNPGVFYTLRWANLSDSFLYWTTTNSPSYRVVYEVDVSTMPPPWRLVTGGTSTADDLTPSYSPDDSKICFQRVGTGAGIYVANRDGTGAVRIRSTGSYPCWKRPAP